MKRLLFVSNLFPDAESPYRGLDNATLLHALASEWEVRVISPRPTRPFQWKALSPRPIDRRFSPRYLLSPYLPKIGSRWNHLLMARALRGAVRAETFDVVLGSWLFPDGCAIARLARESRFPFVAIAQGSDVHQYLRRPVRRRLIVEAMNEASAVITRSAELARLLGEAGVASAKLHPIYNGIDHDCFHPGSPAGAEPVILFVGNFVAIKNPLLLIEALSIVCRHPRLQRARLMLVGSGPLEAAMRAAVRKRGLTERVEFTGRLGSAAIAERMRAAGVLALPSDNEGVPNVILEAFGCGLPVVACRVGGIAEVHPGEACGRLIPPRDAATLATALTGVLLEPPDRAAVAERGRAFSWARTAAEYGALLSRAAE